MKICLLHIHTTRPDPWQCHRTYKFSFAGSSSENTLLSLRALFGTNGGSGWNGSGASGWSLSSSSSLWIYLSFTVFFSYKQHQSTAWLFFVLWLYETRKVMNSILIFSAFLLLTIHRGLVRNGRKGNCDWTNSFEGFWTGLLILFCWILLWIWFLLIIQFGWEK